VEKLFPEQEGMARTSLIVNRASIKLTSAEEVLQVLKTILDDMAPGSDGIPNKVLKISIKAKTKEYVDMYNACLTEGVFPSRWKTQRLVLIPKGEKPAEEPSSYRPLCMLGTVGKILVRIIHSRLEGALVETNGLSEMQYGFRKGHPPSTPSVNCVKSQIKPLRGKGGCTALSSTA